MSDLILKNKNILITGGNKGIGLAISKRLMDYGANIISINRSEPDNSIISNNLYKEKFRNILCDISDENCLKSILSEITQSFENIDILINNAGISEFKPFAETNLDNIGRILNTNLNSAMIVTHFILNKMILNKSGLIVNIESISVRHDFANCSVYNASKSGLLSFSRSIRNEVRHYGIKIIDILPGATITNIWDETSIENFGHKMMLPEDIAGVVSSAIELSLNNRIMIEEIVISPQLGNL